MDRWAKGRRRLAARDDSAPTVKSLRRRIGVWLVRGIPLALLGFSLLFFRFLFLGNFAVVDPGKVYRSAQPQGDMSWLSDYHVATVLNLRGGSKADPWYAAEVKACDQRRIAFYDLPLLATQQPSRNQLRLLLDLLQRCEYPLLIHCKSGSDRTGLVSALYRLSVLGEPPERALQAFSVWRGHFPIGGPEALHEPIRKYAAWLSEYHLPHTPERFRGWVEQNYRFDEPEPNVVFPLQPGPRPQITTRPGPPRR